MCTLPLNLNPFSIFPFTSPMSLAFSCQSLLFVPQQEEGPPGKQVSMMPLIIPVSVPVHRGPTDTQGGWAQGRLGDRPGQPDRKPSVIVARRRSLRNSMTDSFGQVSF